MKALLVICALAVTSAASLAVTAQTFPSRPITMVVPFSAGGPTDTLARIMSEPLRKALNQVVVVENTTGAGGTIATGRVVRAAPDGYVLVIGHWGTHVVNGAYYTLPFDLLHDLAQVAMIADNPQMIVSRLGVPAQNLKELNAWITAHQGTAKIGTGGVGGASHMAGIYYLNRIGAKLPFIPYRGGAPALQALLASEIDIYVTQVGSGIELVRAGKIRAYAVTAPKRQEAGPEIPTVDEAGLPGLHTSVWHGIWAPKGTPRDVIMKLNAAIVETLADRNVRQRFANLGQEIPPREQQTPEALYAHQKAEIERWWPLIRAAGLKAE
ncbi:MAG TPA: tripartite tricarboxylate transporter substrate-binding protein [Burkholderiales bacterium]|nr:tripartite tricarboxylate transporter substrate-binding protein [Burkholderiales bacterium]